MCVCVVYEMAKANAFDINNANLLRSDKEQMQSQLSNTCTVYLHLNSKQIAPMCVEWVLMLGSTHLKALCHVPQFN